MNLFVAADGRLRAVWRFLLGILVAYLANAFAVGVALRAGPAMSYGFEAVYRPALVVFLLIGFSILLAAADRESRPLLAMGLGRPWYSDTVRGLMIGAGMVVVAAAAIAVGGTLSFNAVWSARVIVQVMVVIFVLATAAMAEELVFRGYPFQRLIEAVGAWPAVILMSVPFGAVHLGNPHASGWSMANTILIGALLCCAYLRTWKLWLPFGIHLGWNAMLGLVLGLPVSGLNEFSVAVRGRARGPVWLTGGSYGIEASAVATGVILLGFLALVAFVPQAERPHAVQMELPEPEPSLFPDPPSPQEEVTPSGTGQNPDGAPPSTPHPTE